MESIAENLRGLRQRVVVLPDGSRCKTCGFWNTQDPEVQRIMREAGKPLAHAACRCPDKRRENEGRARQQRQWANLPHEREGYQRTFANFRVRAELVEAFKAAQEFARDAGPRVLVMVGGVRIGKSHLFEAIGRSYLERGRSCRYDLAADLIDRFRKAASGESEMSSPALMEWYKTMPVLLIDDLGMERIKDFANEVLTVLVEDKMVNGGRVAIATNLTHEETREHYGDRLAARLWGGSDPDVVRRITIDATEYRPGKHTANGR